MRQKNANYSAENWRESSIIVIITLTPGTLICLLIFYQYEEEIEHLKATGVKTKTHTVELCRLMVRVTDLNTKMTLAGLIRNADTPCRFGRLLV
jgi:hypothetical protein